MRRLLFDSARQIGVRVWPIVYSQMSPGLQYAYDHFPPEIRGAIQNAIVDSTFSQRAQQQVLRLGQALANGGVDATMLQAVTTFVGSLLTTGFIMARSS